jgi:hypothetical protein
LKVTPETYIRAESDRQFGEVAKMAGGVNRLYHFRRPTPLDKQNVVRMNRDTLYSMGVVDTSEGATITIPELPKDRYASVYLVDNDHYCPLVRNKPAAYGRATLGAKPFRRAPVRTSTETYRCGTTDNEFCGVVN